jgi:fructokinase
MDQFPDGQQVLGGAPFNVVWHLQAFGQYPCFISRVGNDAMGDSIRQAMADWGMSVENLQTDPDYPTGTVKVTLNKNEPCYEILADQTYDQLRSSSHPRFHRYIFQPQIKTYVKMAAVQRNYRRIL